MKPTTDTEEYICEDCGTTTPVQNESCPNCGGKLVSTATMREPSHAELLDEEEEELDDDHSNLTDAAADGSESLEALREDEFEEDNESYARDNYSDDE